MWSTAHARDTLAFVDKQSQEANTVVVLFIHGWHHNAAPDDANLEHFQASLNELSKIFKTWYPDKKDEVKIIGVYVGWRGESLPSALDYLTIWDRKPGAERVGEGDVSEFIARLQLIYQTRQKDSPNHFMGLVSIGHSLGAQVLYKSVSKTLENGLIQNTDAFAGTGIGAESQPLLVPPPVQSIGDIVLLVNPAIEAYQFQRFHRLYRSRKYDDRQDPVLIVFSSETDRARSVIFPMSRWVTRPFRPLFRTTEQAELFNKALGDYEPQVTHVLEKAPDGANETLCGDDSDCLKREDLSGRVIMGNALMKPRPGVSEILYSPVLVSAVDPAIIDGHSDIFNPRFRLFLANYIAEIERKRLNRADLKSAEKKE
ncbi:hypothetical protein GCM10027277_51720 [Pseudoduganella ginsengisoli]